ncbi:hypothetical protein [Synechococcus sp. 1G10]|uniref:hypothetical protein n=1 Tax=Synechococcus sp. 1G10 TaxID=2025605 RepID=UPI00117FCFAD|nr:hypothetical protein [Synechococcus sp. 1G10]
MAYKVEFVEKIDKNTMKKNTDGSNSNTLDPRRVDNLTTLCCWCYKITKEPRDPWSGLWAIDVPKTIDVKNPDELKGCTECNKYERVPGQGADSDKWIILPTPKTTPPDTQNEITVCFVAPCGENTTGANFSAELLPSGGHWTKHGESHVVVSPLASLPSRPGKLQSPSEVMLAIVAHYEGMKLASLLNEVRQTAESVPYSLDQRFVDLVRQPEASGGMGEGGLAELA